MALQTVIVTDFTFGEVSPRYAGRMTTELRSKAVEYLKGFVLGPDGGVRRRPGSIYVRSGVGISPQTDRLYDATGVPSFVLWRDGTSRWIGFVQQSPRAWVARKIEDTDTLSVTDASVEYGVPIGTTGTFYDPETDAEYVHVWTTGDSFDHPVDSPASITRREQVDLAVVYQNRLIGINRTTSALWMSKVMDLFDFTDQGPQSIFYELDGTATTTEGSLTLTGSGTQFTVDLEEGEDIRVATGAASDRRTIDEITSDTVLTVTQAFGEDHTADTVYLVTDGLADPRPLYALPDWADAEVAQWLVARQSVYVGTDAAEYEIFSSFPYFDREAGGLMIRRITDIGSEHAAYLGSGLAVQSASHAMVIGYTGQSFQYQAAGLTDRVDNNRLLTVQAVEQGTHRYLLVLDVDGVLWCYMSNPAAGVDGWCELEHDVGWVFVFQKDIYVAIERDSAYYVEVLPLDGLTHPGDRSKIEEAIFFANDAHGDQGGCTVLTSTLSSWGYLPVSTTMDVYDVSLTDQHSTYLGQADTDASGEIAATVLSTLAGWTATDADAYLYAHAEDTYPEGELRTLPLGGLIGTYSRISKVILQVWESSGAKVRVNEGTWEQYTSTSLESGTWEFRVEHNQEEEPRVTVATVDAHPLNIYQIRVIVDIGG